MPLTVKPGDKVSCSACKEGFAIGLPPQEPPALADPVVELQKAKWVAGVREVRQKALEHMRVPLWAGNCVCPECKKPIGNEGVRGIGLRLNAQHFGDIVVDGHCLVCDSMLNFHYRKACETIGQLRTLLEFSAVTDADRKMIEPVLFQTIKPEQNNIVDIMCQRQENTPPVEK